MKTAVCLDPFDSTNKAAKAVFAAVQLIKGKGGAELAVYAASPLENKLNLAFDVPAAERFTSYPRTKLEKFVKKIRKLAGDVTAKVVRSSAHSHRGVARDLCAALDKDGVELLALPTHARKGLARFVLGSFAETVMNTSRARLLVVNPRAKVASKLKTILFATDFSDEDLEAFKHVMAMAAKRKADIVVTHVWETPILPETDAVTADAYIEQARKWVDSRAELFGATAAKARDLYCEIENVKRTDRVESVICKRAKKHGAELIVTVSKLGPVGAGFLGSVSRGVVREANCPVLVFRTK